MGGRGPVSGSCAGTLIAVVLTGSLPAALQPSVVVYALTGTTLDQARADEPWAEWEAAFEKAQYADARARARECAAINDRLGSLRSIGRANHLLSMIANVSGDRADAEARAR